MRHSDGKAEDLVRKRVPTALCGISFYYSLSSDVANNNRPIERAMSSKNACATHGRRTEEALDAARCGQAYEVEEAIHLGADVSASDPHGMTALHYAAARYGKRLHQHYSFLQFVMRPGNRECSLFLSTRRI